MTKRTYQVVRNAVDTAMGTLSCNWCFKPKPAAEVTEKTRANGRKGHICDKCRDAIKRRKNR